MSHPRYSYGFDYSQQTPSGLEALLVLADYVGYAYGMVRHSLCRGKAACRLAWGLA